MDKLRGNNGASLKEVRAAYKKAGISVKGTWLEGKKKTVASAKQASTGAVQAAKDTKTGIDAVNLTPSGLAMMAELANGIDAGIPMVSAAAHRAAAAAAAPIEANSPPKVGPLSKIDKWGER